MTARVGKPAMGSAAHLETVANSTQTERLEAAAQQQPLLATTILIARQAKPAPVEKPVTTPVIPAATLNKASVLSNHSRPSPFSAWMKMATLF